MPRVQELGRVTPFNKAIMATQKGTGVHSCTLCGTKPGSVHLVETFLMSQGEGLSHNYVDLNCLPASPLAVLH